MRQELIFNNRHNGYTVGKHCFQTNKKPININEIDSKKILLSNKVSYGKQGANKYYTGYFHDDFRPMCIIIKEIKLYTDPINILGNNKEFLKYIEIWKKIDALFNEKHNKRGLYNKPASNNEYVRPKINRFNGNFHGNKTLTKDEYYDNSILLIESICEVKNKYHHQTFLDKFFEKQ